MRFVVFENEKRSAVRVKIEIGPLVVGKRYFVAQKCINPGLIRKFDGSTYRLVKIVDRSICRRITIKTVIIIIIK